MALISLTNGYLSFSDAPLLDHAELHIEPNERVCLVGRNGAGKSTLLKIIAGDMLMDDGKIQYEKDLVVSRLEQDPPRNAQGNIFDYVAEGVGHLTDLLKEYHHISSSEVRKQFLIAKDAIQILQDTLPKELHGLSSYLFSEDNHEK